MRLAVKVTPKVQLPPAATPVPAMGQVLLMIANRPGLVPPRKIREITTGTVPVLVKVTVCATVVVLIGCDPNGIDAGDTLTVGRTVVPVKETEPETAGAETRTFSVAVCVAVLLGVNTTFTVQLAPAASPLPRIGQFVVCPNRAGFAPPKLMPVMISAPAPVFVTVTGCDALVTFSGELKDRLRGLNPRAGPAAVMVNVAVL